MDTIYERIKNRRKSLNLSADDVAAALKVSRATIYRYESADIEKIPTSILAELAKVLHTTPAYLMGWTEDPANLESPDEPKYYYDAETAALAQELFDNKDMRILFDAARDSKPEDLKIAADLLSRLKSTNPDG